MILLRKHATQLLSLSVIALPLIMLLTACTNPINLGSIASSPKLTLTTYRGEWYTISYPKNWTRNTKDWMKDIESDNTEFQDSQNGNLLDVAEASTPHGRVDPNATLDGAIKAAIKSQKATNASPASLPTSVSFAGETWIQKGITGTVTGNFGIKVSVEVVFLVTNHPANGSNTKFFMLGYGGAMLGSKLEDEQIFHATLASFKFTS